MLIVADVGSKSPIEHLQLWFLIKCEKHFLSLAVAFFLDKLYRLIKTDAIGRHILGNRDKLAVVLDIGTKLAGREPDKKHPFGYGRIEYLSAMIISMIVLYAGVTSFIESVKQIIDPQTPEYNTVSLIIVAVAVVVKIILGRYVKGVGEKVNYDSLVNSGEDATLDSVISASTLVAAGIFLLSGVSLEAWLGARYTELMIWC